MPTLSAQASSAQKPQSVITAEGVKTSIIQLRATARTKAKEADEAFLAHADPRAVQGGAICEEAQQWLALAAALSQAILFAEEIEE